LFLFQILRVSEKRLLRRIFRHKKDVVIGDWRKLLEEERHYLHSSPNIISMTQPRKMRWADYVA
jgi:hypothetical protein